MSTFAGKDLRSYPDQICGGRTKSASVICPPGLNLLALSVPPDQIRGRTDFTVTPAAISKLRSAFFTGYKNKICTYYVIVKSRQRGNFAANSPSPRALARGRGLLQHNFRGNPLL